MKKWVPAMLLAACVAALSGCKRVVNLDNDPTFKPMIGKSYKTTTDLAVIKHQDDRKTFVLDIPGTGDSPKIKDMPKVFPFEYFAATVYGVLPTGTTFQIMHVERVSTIEFSFVDIYAKVTSEGNFKGTVMDVGIVTDQTKKPPVFRDKYAEEIAAATGK